MFQLSVIEESLDDKNVINNLKQYLARQWIENVPKDEYPIWHINEYHVPEKKIDELLNLLTLHVKPTWYIHAFNDTKLCVVFVGRYFEVAPYRDETWNEMIEYGVEVAGVERQYIENML